MSEGKVTCYSHDGLKYSVIGLDKIKKMSIRTLCEAPYAIKIEWMDKVIYFASEGAYDDLKSKGKEVCLFVELTEAWRKKLLNWGCDVKDSYDWTLEDYQKHEMTMRVFPKAEQVDFIQQLDYLDKKPAKLEFGVKKCPF